MIKTGRFLSELQKKNIWFYLHAGPGYGKTYVVKKFLEERTESHCYICFSEADNDFELLKNHIYVEIQLYYGEILHKISSKKRQNDLHIETAGHFICNEIGLMNELLRCKQALSVILENMFLVFDNVSCIHNKKCLKLLELLSGACMEHGHLFLLSRREEMWLVKQKFSGKCIEIGEEEFCFTYEETKRYLEKEVSYAPSISTRAAQILMKQFYGWPTGICQSAGLLKDYLEENVPIRWTEILDKTFLSTYIEKELLGTISTEGNLFYLTPVFQKVFGMRADKENFQKEFGTVIDYYLEKKEYSAIESLQRQLSEGAFLVEANLCLLENYEEALVKTECYEILENALLSLMNQGVMLSTRILRVAVTLYEIRRNQGDMCCEERTFYQNLISYNEQPKHGAAYFKGVFLKKRDDARMKLNVQMFGDFTVRILSDGKKLSWRTKKGCELFALLYSMQGKALNRQTLLEKLWQEEMPKNAVIMLHNMIYNIRKALMPYELDKILVYEEHKYKLKIDQIESDFLRVKRLCNMVEEKKIEELLENRKYFQTYWGSYLSNIDCHWGMICREYYDKTYQTGCMLLASYFIGFENYLEAVPYLENVLLLDNLQEEACIKLIHCYGVLGNRKKAKTIYTKFCYNLKCEINVEPSEKLRTTYEYCMRGHENNRKTLKKDTMRCQ